MSFFSIIIPTYNRAAFLRQALQSVQRQTFRDFECWVVDDASTDESPAIIKEFLKDHRFYTVCNATNRRQHFCRNRVIEKSTAAWITFLDSDDIWLPQRLQTFYEAIQHSPKIEFWFSNGFWLEGDQVVGQFFEQDRILPNGNVPITDIIDIASPPFVTTNVALRRQCFERFGLFREDMQILEDNEFYVRIRAAGIPVGGIRECLSLYRFHPTQITRAYVRQFEEFVLSLKSAKIPTEAYQKRYSAEVRNTAVFLLKNLEPKEARAFLKSQNTRIAHFFIWLATFLPVSALRTLRTLYHGRFRFSNPRSLPGAKDAEQFVQALQN